MIHMKIRIEEPRIAYLFKIIQCHQNRILTVQVHMFSSVNYPQASQKTLSISQVLMSCFHMRQAQDSSSICTIATHPYLCICNPMHYQSLSKALSKCTPYPFYPLCIGTNPGNHYLLILQVNCLCLPQSPYPPLSPLTRLLPFWSHGLSPCQCLS